MSSAFNQQCPRYSGTLTLTAPTAIKTMGNLYLNFIPSSTAHKLNLQSPRIFPILLQLLKKDQRLINKNFIRTDSLILSMEQRTTCIEAIFGPRLRSKCESGNIKFHCMISLAQYFCCFISVSI